MLFWSMLALQAAPMAGAFDLGQVRRPPEPVTASIVPRCDADDRESNIVVCGGRKDRYRLPLPDERTETADMPPRDAPGGMAALTPAADAAFSPANAGAASGKQLGTVMDRGVIRSPSSPGLPGKRLILTLA